MRVRTLIAVAALSLTCFAPDASGNLTVTKATRRFYGLNSICKGQPS
jgi:hypothetical protein